MIAAVSNMFKDLLNGQDIQDPFTTDNIARAFTSGGGAGFAGDIFVSSMGDYKYGHPNVYNAFGPVISSALDAVEIFDKYKDDRDIGANVLRFAKSSAQRRQNPGGENAEEFCRTYCGKGQARGGQA